MKDEELLAMADAMPQPDFSRRRRTMEHFRYDEIQEKYWDITTGELLGPKSVDGAISKDDWPTTVTEKGKVQRFKPSVAINDVDTGLTVETSTWWPGGGQFLLNQMVNDRGLIPLRGAVTYNRYIPPNHDDLRFDRNPDPWLEHVKFIYPDPVEHEHFFDYCAHMVQRPQQKTNHGIVITGAQGIGKDTMLAPIRKAVGEHNVCEIEPDEISSPYSHYVKSVMLVVNEVRPHDEDHKASNFYNQLKPLLAAPPEVLQLSMKYQNPVYVRNVVRTFLTTNDPLTMYIPEEDRRLFVMNSPIPDPKRNPVFSASYFTKLWRYLEEGGCDAVINWLRNRDVSEFKYGEPPPTTAGKQEIINSAQHIRRTPIDELMERYCEWFGNKPQVIFARDLYAFVDASEFFDDADTIRKAIKARNVHFKMAEHGYAMERNPNASEWVNGKFRSRTVYVLKEMSKEERYKTITAALQKRPLEFRTMNEKNGNYDF